MVLSHATSFVARFRRFGSRLVSIYWITRWDVTEN